MAALKNSHYFASSPDCNILSNDPSHPELALLTLTPEASPIEIVRQREVLAVKEAEWSRRNASWKYWAYTCRDKKYQQVTVTISAPLLFVTHGGGWIQGSLTTEDIFLLRPIGQNFTFTIVSVSYRLAPEYVYPTPLNDCWGALQWVLANPKSLSIDPSKILLAGSSAGANLTAAVASMARDAKISGLSGVVLNVPVLCHPDHFPQEKYELRSYEQCTGTLLHSVEMRQCWDLYVPDEKETGASPLVSLLLSDHRGLPPTHIFVAGQYPVRDEGIAYAEALQAAGVHAKLSVYGGVPHTLAEFDELETTGSFIRILWLV